MLLPLCPGLGRWTKPFRTCRVFAIAIAVCLCGSGSGSLGDEPELTVDPRIEEAEQRRIEAINKAMPATVSIFVPGGGGGGSGVLISPDGFALTNFHVTSPAGSFMRCGLSDGRIYNAVIIGIDPVGDLALIRLLGRDDFPHAELANSSQARPGQWCLVIGNPFLLATNLQPTVTWGILSGVGRYQYPAGTLLEYADCLQTDASINPGNSGGPLFDENGRLLGIVGRASFEKRGRVNVGVGYAISINQAKNFLGDLHSGRILDHATLGATVATDSEEGGAQISNILRTSDAYRRGLRYGNTVLEIDGRDVTTANEVQNVLATLPAGWRVPIVYLDSAGERKSTLVRLASVHAYDELLLKMEAALPPPPPQSPPGGDGDRPAPEGGDDAPEKDAPGENEKKNGPEPPGEAPGKGPKVDLPPDVAAQFEPRRGFANYYVNRLKQRELIAALRDQLPAMWGSDKDGPTPSDEAERPVNRPVWRIEGVREGLDPVPVRLYLDDNRYEITLGDKVVQATRLAELAEGVDAANPSGILAALEVWRTLLIRGTEKFGECFYRGRVPYLGERPLRDALVGITGDFESTWLIHPESRRLDGIEIVADRDLDPAELLLSWGDEKVGHPTGLELRYGTESLLKVKITSWAFETRTAAEGVADVPPAPQPQRDQVPGGDQ